MCNCKRFELSQTPVAKDGTVIQKCKECGKETKIPGTIFAVIDWMEARPEYQKNMNLIRIYHGKYI